MKGYIKLLFVGFLSVSQYCMAQIVDDTNIKLLKEYLTIQQKRIGFNGVVLIAKNDTILFNEAFGKSSYENNTSLTIDSKFKIASITKSFTAMLTALAVKEGKLNFEDSLAMFYPELKDSSWRKITIEQMRSHSSGIPHNEGIADYWSSTSFLPLNNQQALDEIFKMKLMFVPGTDVKYSSPGYFLLASILENTYKKSYTNLLEEKITTPLGMGETGIFNTKAIITNMSYSYHLLGDSLIVAPYRDFSLMKGSGDMYSNAHDLFKWLKSFGGIMWAKEIREQIFTSYTKGLNNNDHGYGYGWFIRPANDHHKLAYYVRGGTFGCSAISAWYPTEEMAIIILSNISTLPVNELWSDLEKIIFNQSFKLPEIKRDLKISFDQLENLKGSYISSNGDAKLLIISENENLYAKLGNNPIFQIYSDSFLGFYGKKVNVKFTFQQNTEGQIIGLVAEGRGQVLIFNKE
ncbi:serine hydrolase domain-containing protein [Sphingobacterium arenae]|uniref:Beta-lactamase family protein n=1 Tax=Sphingobacterium arenae TaxID=1280598 RepID=A0ABR7Y9C3_9SPHI|nr:serine hydrolase domain-containing protein [Sphingobacterium arenae]MBD1427901.1 beta-lactamase family protein [Sphingobacterium arenae]